MLRFLTSGRSHAMTDKPKIPAEAVDLYTRFIHGEISRRSFMDGVKGFAVAGLTSAAHRSKP